MIWWTGVSLMLMRWGDTWENLFELRSSLEDEMPPPTSQQYFPTKKDIYNHMYCAMVKSRFSNCDQTNAEEKVKEWQMQTPNDKFFFRKYSVTHLWCKIWEWCCKQFQQRRGPEWWGHPCNISSVLSKIPLCPSNNLAEKAVEQIWQWHLPPGCHI